MIQVTEPANVSNALIVAAENGKRKKKCKNIRGNVSIKNASFHFWNVSLVILNTTALMYGRNLITTTGNGDHFIHVLNAGEKECKDMLEK